MKKLTNIFFIHTFCFGEVFRNRKYVQSNLHFPAGKLNSFYLWKEINHNLTMISDLLNLYFIFCIKYRITITTLIASKLNSKFDIT